MTSGNGQLVKTIEIKDQSGNVIATEEVVTYAGLLSLAHEQGLKKVESTIVQLPDQTNGQTAIIIAAVETERGNFKGVGDANPNNVNSRIIPHIIRMAETRAKARAFRDAVNIGLVAIEELSFDQNGNHTRSHEKGNGPPPQSSQMTEAQRRYLFRLLAEREMDPEQAETFLLKRYQVESLDEISKNDARIFIDELVNPAKAEEIPF